MIARRSLVTAYLSFSASSTRYVASGFTTALTTIFSSRAQFSTVSRITRMSAAAISYPTIDNKNLVSVQDCIDAYRQDPSGIVFVDGSWYHRSKRSGREDFEAGPRIPGARYVDMDDICAKGPNENPKDLPHMMPTKELFAAAMDAFAITNDHHVVVYGRDGCVFAPRTYFLFQQCGHDQSSLHLMQGSLEEWIERGGPVEEGPTTVFKADDLDLSKPMKYIARDPSNIVNMDQVLQVVERQDDIILDPRGTTFDKGHMPGAINIPYRTIVGDDLLKFKPKEDLQKIFDENQVDIDTEKRIILSCGSGVSVCHLWLALEELGRDNTNTYVYDGSWAEWGADETTPKVSSEN